MSAENKAKPVDFTVDGQRHRTTDDHQTAASVLRSVGVDPAAYDLAEIKSNGEYHTFRDEQNVHIKSGDEFVTVRQQAPVA